MSANPRLPRLYVEGDNDKRVILALLAGLGIELDKDAGPVIVESKGSCSELLSAFCGAYKSARGFEHPVGFVLDCDRVEDNRKQQVIDRFDDIGYSLNAADFTEDGIVKDVDGTRVGVWMMPNPSASSGKLEDFLRTMIPSDDRVLPIADEYVAKVATGVPVGSRFRDIDREKAEISSWLAVRDPPGASYGVAIKSRMLTTDSPLSRKFHSWFTRLYGIDVV